MSDTLNPVLKYILGLSDSLPNVPFREVRRMRDKVGDDNLAEQRRLSYLDRQAFARERVEEGGLPAALVLAPMIPAEQVVKGLAATPGIGPYVTRATQSLFGVRPLGRSGFHDPIGSMAAGYQGMFQGLVNRYLRPHAQ